MQRVSRRPVPRITGMGHRVRSRAGLRGRARPRSLRPRQRRAWHRRRRPGPPPGRPRGPRTAIRRRRGTPGARRRLRVRPAEKRRTCPLPHTRATTPAATPSPMPVPGTTLFVLRGLIPDLRHGPRARARLGLVPAVPIGVRPATTTVDLGPMLVSATALTTRLGPIFGPTPHTASAAHPAPILVVAAAIRLARIPATVRRRVVRIRRARIRPALVGTPGQVFVLPVRRRLRRGRGGRRVVGRRPAIAESRLAARAATGF